MLSENLTEIFVLGLNFATLHAAYEARSLSPVDVVSEVFARIEASGPDNVWISRVDRDEAIADARALETLPRERWSEMPLFGLPFAVKDCIDVAGVATTCACPEFGGVAERSASAVERLVQAGALYIGKTNLDQFATGLVGTRSPYGTPRNPFNPAYIPGGSSSGSAVAVSSGLVSFALGTDTGGSGRVPASYTNTVGLKPTVGSISPRGLVNACRTIDTISIYALTGSDALAVFSVAQGHEPDIAYSRPPAPAGQTKAAWTIGAPATIGVPGDAQLEFFGDADTPRLYREAIAEMERMGARIVTLDYGPFLEANRMMFFGPLVSERYVSFGEFLNANPDSGDPIVRGIIERAKSFSAAETFKMLYRLEELKRFVAPLWNEIDALLLPTVGRLYTLEDLVADPLTPAYNNGYYTNFANPLDLAAIAVPNGFARDGVPSGVSLVAPAHSEIFLASLGDAFWKRRAPHPGVALNPTTPAGVR